MVATSAAELRANARAVRARLVAPPNAVIDRGINLRAPKQPPAPLIKPAPRIFWMPHKVRISEVLQLVADYYGVPVEVLMTERRTRVLQRMRRICSWLAHECLGRSYPEIATALNRRTHKGMMNGSSRLYEQMKLDRGLAYDVAELELRMAAVGQLLIAARPSPEPRIEEAKRRSTAISRVIQITADFYRIPADCVLGRSCIPSTAKVRHVVCYLSRAILGRSFAEIGRTLGRDHTTVMWAVDRMATQLQTNTELFYDIELLKQQIMFDNRGGV